MRNELTGEFVALDLETTGLFAGTDRIVEVGALRFNAAGQDLDEFDRLVNPGRPISPGAQRVHGISDADVALADPPAAVLADLLEFLGSSLDTQLIAHNARFDAGFLGHELMRCGLTRPGHRLIDTLALSRRLWPAAPDHRLDTLARLAGCDQGAAHRALADCRRVKGLWLALHRDAIPPEWLVSFEILDPALPWQAPAGWDGLSTAIARRLRVRIQYEGGTRGVAPREITPHNFSHRGGMTYVIAFCHLDGFEKAFRLDRVRGYEVIEVETTLASTEEAGRHTASLVSRGEPS